MRFFSRLVSVALLATLLTVTFQSVAAFSDVREGHTYEKAIDLMSVRGIIEGYSDGSFQPARTINRAEFLKIITLSTGYYDSGQTRSCFSDVPAVQWFTPYVCSGFVNGLVSGYPDGTFKPSDPINFVEALKIVENAFGMQYVQDEPWYRGMVDAASRQNLIPLSINEFDHTMTRGETAELIARFITLNEGTLTSFLGDKASFRVSYDTIENNQLLERDWIDFRNSPQPTPSVTTTPIATATPEPSVSAVPTPSPTPSPTATPQPGNQAFLNLGEARNRRYSGDGTYTVTEGDQIELTNGIVIEIESINQPDDSFVIFVHYYLDGKRLTLMPQSLSQTSEHFGTSIAVNLFRRANEDPRFFEMTFTSLREVNSTQDFYDDCKQSGPEDEMDCLKLSTFEPLNGESLKHDGIYYVIYPSSETAVADYYLNQLKLCMPYVMRKTNLNLRSQIVPFRIYYANGKAVTTNKDGIFLPITEEDKNHILNNSHECYDDIVIHELTHLLILPAFIREVLNESFAFYVEKDVQNAIYDSLTRVAQTGTRMVVNDVYRDPTTGIRVKFLGLSTTAKHIPVFQIEEDTNQLEPITFGVGLNTAVSTETFTHTPTNLIIYVRDVHESSPFSTTVDFYTGPPIREFVSCGSGEYTLSHGWRSDNGEVIPAFQFDEYDNTTRTQPTSRYNFIGLDSYLTLQYPWATYYKNFYVAGACMWREYLQQNNLGLSSAFNLISNFQERVVGSKDIYTRELFSLLGGGFQELAQRYGFSALE